MPLPFPWIALFLACGLALIQWLMPQLPLLTRLLMNEFGFVVCLIGSGLAIRDLRRDDLASRHWVPLLGCVLFVPGFLYVGLQLWPAGTL
ncbi:MAG TPA: hypothetical protein VLA26_06190 [Gammaproteobacteria bacterium]|nr:hypothetical protein [Gammaproteobacteria bacterium]